ncbi:MAG: hypothetical protein IJ657_00425 [Acidaminococcaceae bacterium]|nr:hypothetical protein [Acidaminococcaceae bacterium]
MDINKVNLKSAYNGSYYTITGAGGDLQEWIDGYEKMLAEKEIGKPKTWFTAKGAQVNKEFGLTGNEAFKARLTILFFPLDDLDISRLAIFKIRMGDRWFDDVIDNSLRRLEEA